MVIYLSEVLWLMSIIRGVPNYWTHPEDKANKNGGREGKGLELIETTDIV